MGSCQGRLLPQAWRARQIRGPASLAADGIVAAALAIFVRSPSSRRMAARCSLMHIERVVAFAEQSPGAGAGGGSESSW